MIDGVARGVADVGGDVARVAIALWQTRAAHAARTMSDQLWCLKTTSKYRHSELAV